MEEGIEDQPLAKRLIDLTGWLVVFTRQGRYFFYDTIEQKSVWIPPDNLMEYLLEIPEDRRLALFNPCAEFEPEVLIDGGPDICEKVEEEAPLTRNEKKPHWNSKEERHQAIQAFKELLQSAEFNPFQSWPNICKILSTDERYHQVPTDKERKKIFDELCGELAERARGKRKRIMDEAQGQWQKTLEGLTLSTAPPTWTQFSQRVKRESWYKLLDSNQLEKEYRARLKDLQARSIVYQIPK